jgi:hypothetical protein
LGAFLLALEKNLRAFTASVIASLVFVVSKA